MKPLHDIGILKTVPKERLEAYLEAHGWTCTARHGTRYSFWQKTTIDQVFCEVSLSYGFDYDAARSVYQFLGTVSKAEGVKKRDLFEELGGDLTKANGVSIEWESD